MPPLFVVLADKDAAPCSPMSSTVTFTTTFAAVTAVATTTMVVFLSEPPCSGFLPLEKQALTV